MDVPILTEKDVARFWSKVRRDELTGCLLWHGSKVGGRGVLSVGGRPENGGRTIYAHRIAFVLGGGVLTTEKPCVLHSCPSGDNPSCCEFTHLRAGTQAENVEDMVRRRRGRKSRKGLPFGVYVHGERFQVKVRGVFLGSFATPEEAGAVAEGWRIDSLPEILTSA